MKGHLYKMNFYTIIVAVLKNDIIPSVIETLTDRNRQTYLTFFIMGAFFISCAHVNSQHGEKMETKQSKDFTKEISILVESINENDFTKLNPLVSDNFRVPGIPQAMAIDVLKQVVDTYPHHTLNFTIKSIEHKGNEVFVSVLFVRKEKEMSHLLVFDEVGEFVEINLFSAHTEHTEEIEQSNLTVPIFMQSEFELHHNLIIVSAEIDGQKGNFILDSGAPVMILNKHHFSHIDSVNSMGGKGVTGRRMTSTSIQNMKHFKWNDYEMRDFDAVFHDLSHLENELDIKIIGLISYRELEHFETMFDYENMRLMLFKLDEDGYTIAQVQRENPGVEIPFKMEGHTPIFEGSINGKTYTFGLDTGAEFNLMDKPLFDSLAKNITHIKLDTLIGISGEEIETQIGFIDKTVIGGNSYNNMKTVFSSTEHLYKNGETKLDGLLGYEFLSQHKTALNFRKKILTIY
ncbi:MAG: aspartyl protease family protein [Candidatus Marinimicrobia bacterium]|nr:aspartyl protease family protein [Candidatus Neomarinimicrobiota bacterium]